MSFQRYPTYKPSGVEWLGNVPEHWKVVALKRIATLKSGDSITSESVKDTGDYPVLARILRGAAAEAIFPLCLLRVGKLRLMGWPVLWCVQLCPECSFARFAAFDVLPAAGTANQPRWGYNAPGRSKS